MAARLIAAIALGLAILASVAFSGDVTVYRVGLGDRERAQAELIAELVYQKLRSTGDGSVSASQYTTDQNCLSCHDGSDAERIDLTDLTVLSDAQKLNILRLTSEGAMPKDREALGLNEMNILLQYLLQKGE